MQREAFFDNGKLVMIFLVVFGHVIQPLITESNAILMMYAFIYLFHMPAMILLSGFFAKGSGEGRFILGLAKKLLIPYLIFQLTYTSYYYFTANTEGQVPLSEPQWSLWFLLSLFSWHLLLIVFKNIKPHIGIPLTILIGLLVGYIDYIDHAFSLSRTIVFFPFFLMGYWLTKEQLYKWHTALFRGLSVSIILGVILALIMLPNFSVQWLFGSYPYRALDAPLLGGVIRGGLYMVSMLVTFCVLSFIPRKEYKWTKLGQQSLYVYLLHGIFIHFFRDTGIIALSNFAEFILVVLISVGIVLLLSSRFVETLFQPIIEIKLPKWKNKIDQVSNSIQTKKTPVER